MTTYALSPNGCRIAAESPQLKRRQGSAAARTPNYLGQDLQRIAGNTDDTGAAAAGPYHLHANVIFNLLPAQVKILIT